ncbi:MAG TPA: magnesium transporter, partial [Planctomycetaceae bacterium]|nr:magnesium transporter [Planctomycetaceae bacterium]
LQTLEEEVVESLLPLVAQAERQDIRRLLSYPADSAGAVMTTDYAWFPQETTVAEALANLRLQAPDRETIYTVYVLESETDRRLVGVVTLEELIRAHPNAKLSEIMDRNVISVRVDEDKEQVAQKLAHYDFIAIPVVDAEGRLVGIVTHDDVIDVLVEAATEDAHRMGGVEPLEENFLEARFLTELRSRSLWLTVLFACQFLTVLVLSHYEGTFEAVPALVFFLPLIIAAGGNAGGQSAALVVRALALGHVRVADLLRVLYRELFQGLTLGALLGLIGYTVAQLMLRHGHQLGSESLEPVQVAVVVGLAVLVVVVWGTLIGALLPLVWKRIGVDPAVTSNPFVTSLVDVTGVAIYFVIASVFI